MLIVVESVMVIILHALDVQMQMRLIMMMKRPSIMIHVFIILESLNLINPLTRRFIL